ncbi:ECF transporter S component [Nocardioides solisilvae]|uniref:ECF transporter S component n=1 Tax=Nocardioides solisilvae TaxID=1542435 RepID=UPI000D746688|nr:ECF transporter S component [Nocardioides solisilvae]
MDVERAVPRSLDDLATALQDLRAEAGEPSYAEIARRVVVARRARGMGEGEARLARTTVYDVFRTGRRRVDSRLVLEIVRALGVEDEGARWWAEACRSARRGTPGPAAPETAAEPAETPAEPLASEPATSPALVPPAVVPPAVVPPGLAAPGTSRWTRRARLPVLLACLAANLLGRVLVDGLGLSIYLDMVGTAAAAIALGPWWGAGVGLATNLVGSVGSGFAESAPFALVNVAGALVWGYGVWRWRMGRTLPRFLVLNLAVAVVCTAIAVPLLLAHGGSVGHAADGIAGNVRVATGSAVLGVLAANLVTSWADKMISGFLALVAVASLPRRVSDQAPG